MSDNRDKQDKETLEGLIRGGILKGDRIKAVVDAWDSPAPTVPVATAVADACVKYADATKALGGCHKSKVKALVYAGELTPFLPAGAQRASGVLKSSLDAYISKVKEEGSKRYATSTTANFSRLA